ncbi:serine protease [Frigidibacter sp. ROC022]|uniref:serine protease n=1 Tax=Frigidibacter sp. ROC022 TaxID=2971796 RepID=UPI00215B111E|nr:trypsin-like peptidase domain-containing protein [Frigidibacter sp. ROC022]MCR8726367.1 trypsin-like peptidase domain-containing protein [Frigidibacter sp. ROC022]
MAQSTGKTWVQIEAHPTLSDGERRARAYAALFPDVEGFRLRSGWYAVALGPFTEAEAAQKLRALRSERLIPADSYLHDGSAYTQQFWPVGGASLSTPLPEAVTPGTGDEVAVAEPTPEVVVEPPPPADETPAQARRSEAALSREERKLIQIALQWEGVYNSGIDGAFGRGTRAAMAAWQALKGYEETGVLTTMQRDELVGDYQAVLASLGIRPVRDNTAGISVDLPMALVEKGADQPPFVHYDSRDGSAVKVILISQAGDESTLFGLYDILQTLEIMPLEGPRQRHKGSFEMEGANAEIISHAEARLTKAGNVKGFILIWPQGDAKRRDLVLSAMRSSFEVMPDSVLPDTAGDGGAQDIDLLAGLEIRRPDVSRSGFYFDAEGHVLTSADAVASCERVTLDTDLEVEVLARDADLGVAVLQAKEPLVPIDFGRLQPGQPRLGSEIAVSGYAYDGRLGAAVLTFGQLADLKGLDGDSRVTRLSLKVTPGDAGGPVFDGSGAVMGLLLPPRNDGQVLPDDAAFALSAETLAGFLAEHGLAPVAAEPAGDIAPEVLTTRARDMTVLVSCWN